MNKTLKLKQTKGINKSSVAVIRFVKIATPVTK